MDEDKVFNVDKMTDMQFGTLARSRYQEASGHWKKELNLEDARSRNVKDYLAKYIEEQLVDERYQEVYLDNRQFTSVRTILPFLTGRVTAPEVVPAGGDDTSLNFAEDFEDALKRHAEKQMARAKIRLAVQEVLIGKRIGYLKWRYDAYLDDVVLEHVPAESCVIGKRSKLFEEPDFFRHTQKRSVGDLLLQFPDKKAKILELFSISRGTPSQLEKEYDIEEDWLWVTLEGKKELVVGWSYNKFVFGKMTDPNFDEGGKNLLDHPMIPFAMFGFLNDGSGWVDQTSFMEQGKYLQRGINRRGQVIAESAKYGGTGVPIFAKGAITQKDVAKIRFSPIQRVLLDTTDVSKAFTTWQAQNLPNFIVEDKMDLRNSLDNIWASNAVLRGQQSENKTATQDILNRNQAEGRLADPVDCIDDSMNRFYLIEAQMMYRYFDCNKFYNYIGNDGKYVSVIVNSKTIAKNLGIQINVKAGTSLPIDRAQRRATVMELAKLNRVSTLDLYKELDVFEDPEAAFKNYMLEQADPKSLLAEVDKTVFDREANQDLIEVIGGKMPAEREDISEEYMKHLNEYLMTDKYKLLKQEAQSRVSEFIDNIVAKADRKAAKLAMQPNPEANGPSTGMPTDVPPEVQAMMEQQGGQPGQPPAGAPQPPPQPPADAPPQPPAPTGGGFA